MRKIKRNVFRVLLTILVCLAVIFAGIIVLVNHYYPLRYVEIICEYAEEYDLEPELICAVIHTESKFNKNAISRKGANGLMQIMEDTAYWLAEKSKMDSFGYDQIFDPSTNIRLGCFYLQMLIGQYGDIDTALCAYNAGSGNVNQWLTNPEYSSDGKTLTCIPFSETRKYIKRIAKSKQIYAILLRFSK